MISFRFKKDVALSGNGIIFAWLSQGRAFTKLAADIIIYDCIGRRDRQALPARHAAHGLVLSPTRFLLIICLSVVLYRAGRDIFRRLCRFSVPYNERASPRRTRVHIYARRESPFLSL